MIRPSGRTLAAVVFMSAAAIGAARAGDNDDDLKSLTSDCGGKVEASDINGCLERAREIAETSPSPYLQSLMARLERQAEANAPVSGKKHKNSDTQSADALADSPSANTHPNYTDTYSSDWDDHKVNSDMDSSNLNSGDGTPKEIDMNDDQKAPAEPGPHG